MNGTLYKNCRIHPTALIEENVSIGDGTAIWDNVHIRHGTQIGRNCIIGEKTYIAYDVRLGNYCKLNSSVYVCTGVTIDDYVMLSAHVVFTNDRFPRSFDQHPNGLANSEPNADTLNTQVALGVTVGANATIGPGLTLGKFAMIGMGSVVTHDIPPYGLVIGNPARLVGYACTCGLALIRDNLLKTESSAGHHICKRCGRVYHSTPTGIDEIHVPLQFETENTFR